MPAGCSCGTTTKAPRSPTWRAPWPPPSWSSCDPALGTLNHTALTLEALAHRGLALAGVVIGAWPAEPDLACRSNVRDLETLAARPLAGALPAGAGALDAAEFLLAARAGLAPSLGGAFDAADFRRADHH